MHILFVCRGNIYRSPMAEVVLRAEAKRLGITVAIRSRATENFNIGKGAADQAVLVLKTHGYDLSQHMARQVAVDDIEWADRIYGMDSANVSTLKSKYDLDGHRVATLLSLVGSPNDDVPDPYRQPMEVCERCFLVIRHACLALLEQLA